MPTTTDGVLLAEAKTLPPQVGTWTLIGPDGRQWTGPTPLSVVSQENAERVPAHVRLQRILDGAHAWGEEGIWLRREGNWAVVLIERDGQWIEVIRDVADSPFSHIVEVGGINHAIKKARA